MSKLLVDTIFKMFGDSNINGLESIQPSYATKNAGKPSTFAYVCFDPEIHRPPPCPNFGPSHPSYMPLSQDQPMRWAEPERKEFYLKGGKPSSLVWPYGTPLVRSDFIEAVTAKSHTGFEFHPVSLYTNKSCRVPVEGYREMRVTGRVPIDEEKSGVWLEYQCKVCGARSYSTWNPELGLHLEGDLADWPDVFQMEQRPGITFVKPGLAEYWISLGLNPLVFTDIRKIQPMDYRPPRIKGVSTYVPRWRPERDK